jgi:uncharacterized protein
MLDRSGAAIGIEGMVAFHTTLKPHGSTCNLGCNYCYYNPEMPAGKMDESVLESALEQVIGAQSVEPITIAWQGGEPTLAGLPFFRKAMELQRRLARGKRIVNTLQTNATLLDEEWGRFLADEGFLVGVSLDGPAHLHDKFRISRGGGPTWSQAMRGWEALQKAGVECNTLTTINSANQHAPLEVYGFLRGIGSRWHQYLPVARWREGRLTPDSASPEHAADFLALLFEHWLAEDRESVSVQMFDDMLGRLAWGQEGMCSWNRRCGDTLSIEHDGTVWRCDHLVDREPPAGNLVHQTLQDLLGSPDHYRFRFEKASMLPSVCHVCRWRQACNGGCPEHWDPRTGHYHFCAVMKRLLPRIHEAMQGFDLPQEAPR